MKKLFYLLSLLLATVLANAAELNVYASGLKITGMTDDRQLSISYFLNTAADEVTFLLLNGETPDEANPVMTVALSGRSAGENSAVVNLSAYEGTHYTWAIKAKCNTANTAAYTEVVGSNPENRFKFFSPQGLAVDNNPNSPYFGRIYVTESREEQNAGGRTTKQGVYIFGADLTDITKQGDTAYSGGKNWCETGNENAIFGPARISVDDEGWVYVCDNGPESGQTSGVWRMNPANPSAAFVDVLDNESNYGKQAKRIYRRINSAVVTGTTETGKKLIAVDNLGTGEANSSYLVSFPLGADGKLLVDKTSTQLVDLQNLAQGKTGLINARNTIIRGHNDDLWVVQYRNSAVENITGIVHVNKNNEVDYRRDMFFNRRGAGAISSDGKWFAYCGTMDDKEGNSLIRVVPIVYNNDGVPEVTFGKNEIAIPTTNNENNVDGVAFDVANNLYFVSATSAQFFAYALAKHENTHTTIAPNNQQIRLSAPRILAYNLRAELNDGIYQFSFDANSLPTTAKLLFYAESSRQTQIYEHLVDSPKKGVNKVNIPMNTIVTAVGTSELYWSVYLEGKAITAFGEVFQHPMRLMRGHAAIDNSPASDYFGRIYIANRIGNGNGEVYVLNYNYSTVLANGPRGMLELASAARPAVDAEGYIYWADFGDIHAGVYITDPKTLTSTPFFQGGIDGTGVWTNSAGVAMGSSSSGAHVYGSGAATKLFMMNEDAVGGLPR